MAYLPPIIGITGAAGAGKDTLASHLVSKYGYVRYSCADPIKDLLNARFGWKPEYWEDRHWKEHPQRNHGTNQSGQIWQPFSPRSWAQWLGTEVGRELAGPDVWINTLMAKAYGAGHRQIVIPDIRFDNEAEAVLRNGGVVWKIIRGWVSAVEAHVSEKGVNGRYIDQHFYNDEEPDNMFLDADETLRHWTETVGRGRA